MSKLVRQFRWEKIHNNYAMRINHGRYISYNPSTDEVADRLLGGLIGITESGEETALVDTTNPDHAFRILRGDWRDDYEKLVPRGFEDCVDFFNSKRKEFGGAWSTHEKDRAL